MTVLEWHRYGSRIYESGLDRGVLYVHGQSGVPWNGLTEVEEATNNSVDPVHFDGVKINDIVTIGDFSGVIRAFTYPDEFLECEGIYEDQKGVFITEQRAKRFNLCYRTNINNNAETMIGEYKLHIIYNLTAVPSQKLRQTLSLDVTPVQFEWTVTSIPENISGYRPMSHLIIDSRYIDPWLLEDLEGILYGNEDRDPTLPSLKALTTFIRKWDRLIIVDNGDGTWTAISQRDDQIVMVSETEFTIEADNVVWLDADTYQVSSSDKNEEDI